jgi:capsular polysaccharide biosynthesis protein
MNGLNFQSLSYGGTVGVSNKKSARFGRISRVVTPSLYGRSSLPLSDAQLRPLNLLAPLGFRSIAESICLPNNIFLSQDGRILQPSFLRGRKSVHGGVRYLPAQDRYRLRAEVAGPVLDFGDQPVVSIDTDRPNAYGHVLLETFSRLWAMDRLKVNPDWRIVTSSVLSPGLVAIFALFGVPPERLLQITGPLRCKKVIVPDLSCNRRHWVHPAYFKIIDRIKSLGAGSQVCTRDRIFVSRSKVQGRKLLNEAEVEAYFVGQGFEIFHPQDHALADQIKTFGAAREIVALGGSAAHNAVFAGSDCKVLILCSTGWFVNADILLNRISGRLGYVFGDPVGADRADGRTQADWLIDLATVRDAERRHFCRD